MFQLVYEGFIPIGKIIFTTIYQEASTFKLITVTKADIFLSDFDQVVMLRLQTSIVCVNHTKLLIVIESTIQQYLSEPVLYILFFQDLYPDDSPSFSKVKREFSCEYQINILKYHSAK